MAVFSTYQSKPPYIISTYIDTYGSRVSYPYIKNTNTENWIQLKICERITLALRIKLSCVKHGLKEEILELFYFTEILPLYQAGSGLQCLILYILSSSAEIWW